MTQMTLEAGPQDAVLADRARMALTRSPHVKPGGIELEARDGSITLRGQVRSYFQKQMAQEALRRIEGVHQIENLLQVNW